MSALVFPASSRIEALDLCLARGGRSVVEGASFGLSGGEAMIVTGPNGAGKSTLLRALAGLLAQMSGQITYRGDGLETEGPAVHAHYVGHDEALKGALTARENLAFWAQMLGASGGLSAEAALQRFALPAVADLPVAWLSAGQRRRVALARLLVAPRPVWLLDEPATALDSEAQANFAAVMQEHLSAGGLIIAATHAPLGLVQPRELRLGGGA